MKQHEAYDKIKDDLVDLHRSREGNYNLIEFPKFLVLTQHGYHVLSVRPPDTIAPLGIVSWVSRDELELAMDATDGFVKCAWDAAVWIDIRKEEVTDAKPTAEAPQPFPRPLSSSDTSTNAVIEPKEKLRPTTNSEVRLPETGDELNQRIMDVVDGRIAKIEREVRSKLEKVLKPIAVVQSHAKQLDVSHLVEAGYVPVFVGESGCVTIINDEEAPTLEDIEPEGVTV